MAVQSDTGSDGVTVTVHNVGTPIAPGALERVFHPMQRATSQLENEALRIGIGVANLRDDTAGTGLGLALDEWSGSRPSCAEAAAARDDIAQSLVNQNRLVEATALLAGEPPF